MPTSAAGGVRSGPDEDLGVLSQERVAGSLQAGHRVAVAAACVLNQGRRLRLEPQTTSAATLLAEIERVAKKKLGKAG